MARPITLRISKRIPDNRWWNDSLLKPNLCEVAPRCCDLGHFFAEYLSSFTCFAPHGTCYLLRPARDLFFCAKHLFPCAKTCAGHATGGMNLGLEIGRDL